MNPHPDDSAQPTPQGLTQWIPVGITADHDTRLLIDIRQAAARDTAEQDLADFDAEVGAMSRADREMYLDVRARDIDRHLQRRLQRYADDHDRLRGADPTTVDMFGITRTDADLLVRAGTVNLPPMPLREEAYIVAGAALTLPVGFTTMGTLSGLVAIVLATGEGAFVAGAIAMLIVSLAAFATAGTLAVRKQRRTRDWDHGPKLDTFDGQKTRTFTAGHHQGLADLMRRVHSLATGPTDPLWDFYEELAALADESVRVILAASPNGVITDEVAPAATEYDRALDALADNLAGMCDDRQAARDAEADALTPADPADAAALPSPATTAPDVELLAVRLEEVTQAARAARQTIDWPGAHTGPTAPTEGAERPDTSGRNAAGA